MWPSPRNDQLAYKKMVSLPNIIPLMEMISLLVMKSGGPPIEMTWKTTLLQGILNVLTLIQTTFRLSKWSQ